MVGTGSQYLVVGRGQLIEQVEGVGGGGIWWGGGYRVVGEILRGEMCYS